MRRCIKHPGTVPCTCAMGNVYRFVEPVILYMLKEKGSSYGYDLAQGLKEHALTDSTIEGAALYRTLRKLEGNGYVKSMWDGSGSGPARRVYTLTAAGREHMDEWTVVLQQLSGSLTRFVRKAKAQTARRKQDHTPLPRP